MKLFYKILLIPLTFFTCNQLIRTQTDGFCIEKTYYDFAATPSEKVEVPPQLHQSFHFIGSGVQSYVFLGEDGSTILKLFKHYHAWPSSKTLENLSLPPVLHSWRKKTIAHRLERMENIFTSARIAHDELSQETGTFFLNLNPTENQFPTIALYDNIGILYHLDLNKTPFLLQKKADLIFPYLSSHPEETEQIIDSIFSAICRRASLGIANTDPILHRNLGVIDHKAAEIDIGSFEHALPPKNSLYFRREIFFETLEIEKWIETHCPDHLEYFKKRRLEAIQT